MAGGLSAANNGNLGGNIHHHLVLEGGIGMIDTATMGADYLRGLRLAEPQPSFLAAAADFPQVVFDDAKSQAIIAGSEVVSFTQSVEADFRESISDSALIAQLAANAKFNVEQDPIAWFDHYYSILGGLGWTTQMRDTAQYKFSQDGLEVHEAVLDVVKVFLGPIPGAVKLVEIALTSLKKMNKDSPFITLFNKQSEKSKVGRFQFTLVRQEGNSFLADGMSFGIKAKKNVTQILFFKLHSTEATMRRSLAKISIGADALEGLRPLLKAKIQAHRSKFLVELPITTE
jgi:hypothetical protein